jgi:hypothetical protein
MIINILSGVNFCYNLCMKLNTKRLRAFAYVYYKSLTSFSYYRDVIKTGFKFSVKYFLLLTLAVSLISAIKTIVTVVPEMNKGLERIANGAKSFYPDDLVFTIKNGEWSVNRSEPFIVALPQSDDTQQSSDSPKNLIVFYNSGTIEDLKNLDTMVLVNKVNVLYRDEEGFQGYPIKDLPDSRFDKTEFNKLSTAFVSVIRALPVLFIIMAFVFILLFNLINYSLNFLWVGLLVMLASLILGLKFDYKTSVKIAVHSATLAITLDVLAGVIGYDIPVMFWFPLLNILIAVLVLTNMKKAVKTD